jgi:hypothetical protein
MKRKHWWIFGRYSCWASSPLLKACTYSRTRFFGVSLLLLLPGSLVSFPLSTLGHTGTHWPIWAVYLNAVIGNVLLFAIVSSVVAGIRKSK